MVNVTFIEPDGTRRTISAAIGASLMQAARNEGVAGIEAECGGACSCATCHIHVAEDWAGRLPERSALELDMLDFANRFDPEASRLACQITVTADLDGLLVDVPGQ